MRKVGMLPVAAPGPMKDRNGHPPAGIFESCEHVQPEVGRVMYAWAKELFPLHRSLTGKGNLQTLQYIQAIIPNLKIKSVKSGVRCFDWVIPPEWEVQDAYVLNPQGKKIVDYKQNNLHLMAYSEPVDLRLSLTELQKNLYSLEHQPTAIPYLTTYYKKRWGFCLAHEQRKRLKPGIYRAVIQASKKSGHLVYGELLLPGKFRQEIFLSTYICHPSMANDQLSGVVVQTALARWLQKCRNRNYSLRLIWIPETIGAIAYLAKNLLRMKQRIAVGWQMACLGDPGPFSFLPSRKGTTQADKISKQILTEAGEPFREWSFLKRGSDERQWCFPGVDLPVASIMRSKYGAYPEYHTSLDNLSFITPKALSGSYHLYKKILGLADENHVYRVKTLGEPNLGKRKLYPDLGSVNTASTIEDLSNVISYADGLTSVVEIAEQCKIKSLGCVRILHKLRKAKLVKVKLHCCKPPSEGSQKNG
jgi:aminopeptidase-like protein